MTASVAVLFAYVYWAALMDSLVVELNSSSPAHSATVRIIRILFVMVK